MGPIAFYAPMKPPSHPTPSGDRQMARALMAALGASVEIDLVSELRLYDGEGDAALQATLQDQAEAEAARLIAQGTKWQAWVTYHNYYKAPDIIGPLVSGALNIPYILIESTRSPKRLNGPWSKFAALAETASNHADLIFYFTDRDFVALDNLKPRHQILTKLHPFLPVETLPRAALLESKSILAVAMFRAGDKMASYELIAQTLPLLTTSNWQLDIAGAGPANAAVQALFEPFTAQVNFLGLLDRVGLNAAYHNATALLWPGINEAFGMVYLEAQAAGVPVVAQDRMGVRDVVQSDGLVPVEKGAAGLAKALDELLQSRALARTRGKAARDMVSQNHLLGTASKTLLNGIASLLPTR